MALVGDGCLVGTGTPSWLACTDTSPSWTRSRVQNCEKHPQSDCSERTSVAGGMLKFNDVKHFSLAVK